MNIAQCSVGRVSLGETSPLDAVEVITAAAVSLQNAAEVSVAASVIASIVLRLEMPPGLPRDLLQSLTDARTVETLRQTIEYVRPYVKAHTVKSLTAHDLHARILRQIELGCGRRRLTLDDVAHSCGVSRWHVCHVLRAHGHTSFRRERRRARLGLARELMNDPTLTLKEICWRAGYSNANLFSRHWREYFGTSPTFFRQQLQIALRK